ncbi:MAG TPA: hypothetical protein VKW76_10275 [Candidatus Binatia bacterium]|nr:hypothetical protein [Candidatus Binatia bacterium]
MRVDVTCSRCGRRERLDVGTPPAGQPLAEYLHLVDERLRHRPSFQCFGGHLELGPPVPGFWEVHWDTVGE